jgi:hypothetical protein
MSGMIKCKFAVLCGGTATIPSLSVTNLLELLREAPHYALGMMKTAFASMLRQTVTPKQSGGRGRMLAAASFCAALLFFGPAFAQDSAETTATDLVAQRLNDNLSREMFGSFGLFIYIDKAERGPFAQRMFVFEKSGDNLALLYDWPVSTGRESLERDAHGHLESTITPVGYYELDPKRLYVDHVSSQWAEDMPYAMFFDWKPNGHDTGLAIHGAAGDAADALGTRASAGCIRISDENAQTLFGLVHDQFQGPVPKLAYLDGESISSEGFLLHDQEGQLKFGNGYSVLVFVDDYVGDSRVSSLF